jgi:hypothetical protein
MAILFIYLSLLYVEKKQRYKHLKQAEHSKCNSKMRHLHKFHRIYHFKVRNLLEIERETIKFYEYFRKYSIDKAEFFGGVFVFLLQILAKFFNI